MMTAGMSLEQGAILASVIRKWYPSICDELCIGHCVPPVRIDYAPTMKALGYVQRGQFCSDPFEIVMFVQEARERVRGSYLFTLAHEARHAWQHIYRAPPSEEDCDDWATRFLRRRKRGPHVEPYDGLIHGQPTYCACGRATWTV